MKQADHNRITRVVAGVLHHTLYKPEEDYEVAARVLEALDELGYDIVTREKPETLREEKSRVDAEIHLGDSRQAWRDMKGDC